MHVIRSTLELPLFNFYFSSWNVHSSPRNTKSKQLEVCSWCSSSRIWYCQFSLCTVRNEVTFGKVCGHKNTLVLLSIHQLLINMMIRQNFNNTVVLLSGFFVSSIVCYYRIQESYELGFPQKTTGHYIE